MSIRVYKDGAWVTVSGKNTSNTSLVTRTVFTHNFTTTSTSRETFNITNTALKTYTLYNITVSGPCWLTTYVSDATRTADMTNRVVTDTDWTFPVPVSDPRPGDGVVAEIVKLSGSTEEFRLSPPSIGWNDNPSPAGEMYVALANFNHDTSSTFTATFQVLPMES